MLLAGIAGAFTTFSTFSFETVQMFREDEYMFAILNIILNNVVCIASIFLGMKLAESF